MYASSMVSFSTPSSLRVCFGIFTYRRTYFLPFTVVWPFFTIIGVSRYSRPRIRCSMGSSTIWIVEMGINFYRIVYVERR